MEKRLDADLDIVVAHVLDMSSPEQGGGRRYFSELIKYALKRGYNVTLLGLDIRGQTFSHPNFKFVPVHRGSDSWLLYVIKLMIRAPFIKIPKCAVILTVGLEYMLPFIIFRNRNPKIFMSDEPLQWISLNYPIIARIIVPTYHFLEKFLLTKIDLLFVDSRNVRYYLERYPQLAKRFLSHRASPVDLKQFKPMNKHKMRKKYGFGDDENIIIFVGRLERRKNVDFLLRCFPMVKEKISNAKLLIVGAGIDQELLMKRVVSLSLEKDVIFMGERPYKEIPELINCADVLALCSTTEGTPTVIAEALACGIPVVSTDVGDVRETTNNIVGRIVKRCESEFADSLIGFLNMNKENKILVKKECIKVARSRSAENVFKSLLEVSNSLLGSCASDLCNS
ncbi:MAG: glycosyltransferase family 4 protein [Candidatus Bathyarchaeota archaeon]|nr:glycosyltransferase family 4 protein [Candidatus Bathyarchaeota archaeon]